MTTKDPKDQYYRLIPRFIVRSFEPEPKISAAERRKVIRAKGTDPCKVKVYDLGDGTLSTRSIGTVYGARNLYDVCRPEDVGSVEQKLSNMEGTIAALLDRLPLSTDATRGLTLTREEIERLRKFMFVVHYRQSQLLSTSISPEILRDHRTSELGLHTSAEMCLQFLQYYMTAPHPAIIKHAATATHKNLTRSTLQDIASTFYQQEISAYYLGFWKASPGQEFILGHNSFGLTEGSSQTCKLHRIHIISPTLAVILRSTQLRPEFSEDGSFPIDYMSKLMSIPMPAAHALFSRVSGLMGASSRTWIPPEHALAHSQSNPRDEFELSVTILSPEQTDIVNSIILNGASDSGTITYLSETSLLGSIGYLQRTTSDKRYKPLTGHLNLPQPFAHTQNDVPSMPADSKESSASDDVTAEPPQSPNDSTEPSGNFEEDSPKTDDGDVLYHLILARLSQNSDTMSYAARYEKANQIFSCIALYPGGRADPFIREYDMHNVMAILRLESILKPARVKHRPTAALRRTLLPSFGNDEARAFVFFSSMGMAFFEVLCIWPTGAVPYKFQQYWWAWFLGLVFCCMKSYFKRWGSLKRVDSDIPIAAFVGRDGMSTVEIEQMRREWRISVEEVLAVGFATWWIQNRGDVFDDMMDFFQPRFIGVSLDFIEGYRRKSQPKARRRAFRKWFY